MPRKPRIFYLAWTPPSTNGGACLAMHRHFVLRNDFELLVGSSNPFQHAQIPNILIQRHPVLERISKTRFSRLIRQFEMTVEPYWMIEQVEPALKEFNPDAIFTIPDNTLSWTAYLLAQRTGLPLITNFQDWWPKGQFTLNLEKPYSPARSLLEKRFHQMYRASAISFCTSAGMKQKLGNHPNAPVLLPCPAARDVNLQPDFIPPSGDRPLRLVYAGTIINAYGRSVLNLAKALRGRREFEFHVYGPPPDWSAKDRAWMESEGIYRGLLPHAQLKAKLWEADACLVVMSFEPQLRLMMETSFTTKFLEYCQYGKPVIVWGPDYCQPVRVAQIDGAGLAITTPDTTEVVTALQSLQNETTWITLAHGAWKAANGIFNPEQIHSVFKDSIYNLLNQPSIN